MEKDGKVTLEIWLKRGETIESDNMGPNPVTLRPYQAEAVSMWLASRRGIVELPTGTGKTYLAMYIIWEYLKDGKRVAVIVPTQYLAHQWKEKMKAYGFRGIGLFYANEKKLGEITVFVYNSAIMNPEKVLEHDLIVVDEIHHFGAEGGLPLLKAMVDCGKDILGLTATLERADNRHFAIKALVPVVYRMSVSKAIAQGYIVRAEVIPVEATLTMWERVRYEEIEQEIREIARRLDGTGASLAMWRSPIRLLNSRERPLTLSRKEKLKKRLMILINMRKQLTSEAVDKKHKVYEIIQRHQGERVIVFSESIRTVEELKKYLLERGVRCETIHSKKPMRKRRQILEAWGRDFDVLLAVRSLDEGIDVPEVGVGIIVSSGLATRQNVQRIGRLVRPAPGKKKATIYVVYARGTFEERLVRKIKRIVESDARMEWGSW